MENLKEYRRPKIFNTIVSPNIKNNYQMDILVYNRYKWNRYSYILCIIDVYSRFAYAVPLTNMKDATILDEIKKCFDIMGKPKNMNCDNQFNTININKYFEENKIITYFNQPDEVNKNAIVERFNRTLARMLQIYRVTNENYDWPSYLSKVIDQYNNSFHRTIKQKPIDIFKHGKSNEQTIIKLKNKFKIGDIVKIKKKKNIFDKGDAIMISKSQYTINKINKNKNYLMNDKNEILERTYKDYELIKSSKVIELTDIPHNKEDVKEQEQEHIKTQQQLKAKRIYNKEGLDNDKETGDVIIEDKLKPSRPKREVKPNRRYKDYIKY